MLILELPKILPSERKHDMLTIGSMADSASIRALAFSLLGLAGVGVLWAVVLVIVLSNQGSSLPTAFDSKANLDWKTTIPIGLSLLALGVSLASLFLKHLYSRDEVRGIVGTARILNVGERIEMHFEATVCNSGTRTIMLKHAEFLIWREAAPRAYQGISSDQKVSQVLPIFIPKGEFQHLVFTQVLPKRLLVEFAHKHLTAQQDAIGPFECYLGVDAITVDGAKLGKREKQFGFTLSTEGNHKGWHSYDPPPFVLSKSGFHLDGTAG